MLSKKNKQQAIKESQTHETDTGSPEVQVSLLTRKIKELAAHLKKHRKDKHSRRGLLGMVERRRKHLKHLLKKDPERHEAVSQKIKDEKEQKAA